MEEVQKQIAFTSHKAVKMDQMKGQTVSIGTVCRVTGSVLITCNV